MKQSKNNTKKEEELIEKADQTISELVYEKSTVIKAYNYYHAKRDPDQFRHLEENYGIGTPTSVEFVPLVRKHIDVLIGEYLSTPVLPKVSCKDKDTLSNIYKDKQLAISKSAADILKEHLKTRIYGDIMGNVQAADAEVQKRLKVLQDSLEKNFISEYEIAGQNIVDYAMQARNIDFANKRKILLTDLLVAGMCYYKVEASPSGENMWLVELNPINTFIDRNPLSPYLNESSRAVVRDWMTKDMILSKYGHLLDKDDLEDIENKSGYDMESNATYLRSYDNNTGNFISEGILGGYEVSPLLPFERNSTKHYRLFPVYTTEWLQTDQEDGEYIVNRYEVTRIGSDIYILTGKVRDVIRTKDDPKNCKLSINGIFYSDRNGDPFSLVIKTANLQDKFDVLNFFRDNIIAESGSIGDWLDVAHLPKFLGNDVTERLMKWKAYKKSGIALYDSSQEGEMINTAFNGYDDTIKAQTIQAIDLAIQRVEETTSTITGVFKEKLGGIEQRDAVTNVQVGVTQSSYITKQYYQLMDLMTREILIDLLNTAKRVYKKGISGTLVLGERLNKIFTALPEYYTITDFDIHISDSSEIKREQEIIRQLTTELVKNNTADAEIIIEVATASGLTKMKSEVLNALNRKKEEAGEMQKLTQELEQAKQQLQQLTAERDKLQQQATQIEQAKLQLEKNKQEYEEDLGWFTAKSDDRFNKDKIELDKQRVTLEGLQLIDNNKNNDEIRND